MVQSEKFQVVLSQEAQLLRLESMATFEIQLSSKEGSVIYQIRTAIALLELYQLEVAHLVEISHSSHLLLHIAQKLQLLIMTYKQNVAQISWNNMHRKT